MNRKQKIIVSVTGIFLVLLILVGLTYAYFLTQITGNTKDKSISVTTADLRVVYGDGTKELLTSTTKLVPSSESINTKDFTVTNTGDKTEYAVMIENVRVKISGTENLTIFESNDFKYTLTCTKSDGSSCNGVDTQTTLPMSDNILVTNEIDSEDTHTYSITLWYLDNGRDQSADMNKTLEARINIEDPNRINPYSNKPNSLAYNIINNALNVSEENEAKGYALYRSTPLTEPAKELSLEMEGSLSQAPDDQTELTGFNSFYFRGNVKNNYVTFNNMCWRIVRIEGDGSVKLLLADKDAGCSSATLDKTDSAFIGSGNYNINAYISSHVGNIYIAERNYDSMRVSFNNWLNSTKFTDLTRKALKNDNWCIGNLEGVLGKDYGTFSGQNRYLNNAPSLICDNTGIIGDVDANKIGTLTLDEVLYAGAGHSSNQTYYIKANALSDYGWWLITPSYVYDALYFVYTLSANYEFSEQEVLLPSSFPAYRPAISLITGIEIVSGGIGTIDNPYVISTN